MSDNVYIDCKTGKYMLYPTIFKSVLSGFVVDQYALYNVLYLESKKFSPFNA